MAKIWHLRVETVKRRKQQGLPPVEDANDLPNPGQAKDYVSVGSSLRYRFTSTLFHLIVLL